MPSGEINNMKHNIIWQVIVTWNPSHPSLIYPQGQRFKVSKHKLFSHLLWQGRQSQTSFSSQGSQSYVFFSSIMTRKVITNSLLILWVIKSYLKPNARNFFWTIRTHVWKLHITNLSIEGIGLKNLSQPRSSCMWHLRNFIFLSWRYLEELYIYGFELY